MEDDTSTLTVEGFTPYAQIPRWVLRAGDQLSHGAVRLYGIIMTYADNNSRAAFPGREKLAGDLGIKARTVSTYIKELEEFGAMRVTRRRNKRTGNFYANHYVLVFSDPCAEDCTPRDAQDCRIPRTTSEPRLSSPTPSSVDEEVPRYRSPSLSERRSDRDLLEAVKEISRATTDDEYEAASENFIAAFEDAHGEDIGFWDYGWSNSLDRHVRDHGIDYGSAKWLGTFTNTRNAT